MTDHTKRVPKDYYKPAEKSGRIEELLYDSRMYCADNTPVKKRALVYLPNGYDDGIPKSWTVVAANRSLSELKSVEAFYHTGANDGTYIEVLSGLSEGEVVVTSGMEGLTDGAHAEIVLDDTDAKGGAAR